MATVKIDRGIQATFLLDAVPPDRWMELVKARSTFAAVHITTDCRCLMKWLEDAEKMWFQLGFENADDLIARGYELDPEEIRLAVRWLELNDPNYEIGLPDVVRKAMENPDPQPTLSEAMKGNQNARKTELTESENVSTVSRSKAEYGNRSDYRIRRLRRDHPQAAERLERGEFRSVAAAERWARGEEPHPAYPKKTPKDWLLYWWSKASEEERQEALEEFGAWKKS